MSEVEVKKAWAEVTMKLEPLYAEKARLRLHEAQRVSEYVNNTLSSNELSLHAVENKGQARDQAADIDSLDDLDDLFLTLMCHSEYYIRVRGRVSTVSTMSFGVVT